MSDIERKHANLTASELEGLWDVSSDDALIEWTYRMLEEEACLDDPIAFCEWMLSKRFGKASLTESVTRLATAAPSEFGLTSFLGLRVRAVEGEREVFSELHMTHLYRLLHLYKIGATNLDAFLRGVRTAMGQLESSSSNATGLSKAPERLD